MSNTPQSGGGAEPSPPETKEVAPEPGGTIDAPAKAPMGIVVGGTLSSQREYEIAEQEHRSEMGRRQQDAMFALSETEFHRDGVAKVTSMRLMDRGTPKLVLYYMRRDRSLRQECVAEIIDHFDGDGNPDPFFMLVCWNCLERGIPEGQCQMKVQRSHRHFVLDVRTEYEGGVAGKPIKLIDPWGHPFTVIQAGRVTCNDIIRCSNGCGFAVRIDESKVWEV